MHHDVVVIGAGPAGWTAAMEASALGLDVLLVDRGRRVGGAFVHTGTMPSKVLREMALARRRAERGAPGAALASVCDLSSEVERVIEAHVPSLEQMLASSSVHVRSASASFVSPHELRIATRDSEEIVQADKIIIAAGSMPRRPDGIPFDGCVVCDCDSILRTTTVPERLVVIGAGFAGCELACTFAALGSSVTLVDRRRRILRTLDGEIREFVMEELESMGIRLRTGLELGAVGAVREGGCWKATIELRDEAGPALEADRVLVTLGRDANTLALDLEKAGVAVDATGWIKVDECFRTSASHVYAVGDVTGTTGLAGASAFQGRLAARHAAGWPVRTSVELPIVYYTIPEVAMIGLTEEGCREIGVAHAVGTAHYSRMARTHVTAGSDGLLKLIVRRADRAILGVHVAGEQASELIQLASVLMGQHLTVDTLLDTPYAFPTLSELYRLAAMEAVAGL